MKNLAELITFDSIMFDLVVMIGFVGVIGVYIYTKKYIYFKRKWKC